MLNTIGQRITSGFALILVLVAIVAGGGYWALQRTTNRYEAALEGRRTLLAPALLAESEIRGANVEHLRYLLDGTENFTAATRARVASARNVVNSIQAAAPPGQQERWAEVDSLLNAWVTVAEEASTARRVGNVEEVRRIRSNVLQPTRVELDNRIAERVEWARTYTDSIAREGQETASAAEALLVWGLLAALILGIGAAAWLRRSINGPLQETSAVIAASAAEILAATTEQAAGTNESMAAVS